MRSTGIEASRDDGKNSAPDDTDGTFCCRYCECGFSRRAAQQPVSSLIEAKRSVDYRRPGGSQSYRSERPQLLWLNALPGKRNLYYRARRIELQERRRFAISSYNAAADCRCEPEQQPYPVVFEPLSQLPNIRQYIPATGRSKDRLQFAFLEKKKPGHSPAFLLIRQRQILCGRVSGDPAALCLHRSSRHWRRNS